MKLKDIFNKIEIVIDKEVNKESTGIDQEVEPNSNSKQNHFKEIGYLAIQILVNIVKTPFKLIAKYLRNEIILAVKKDAKIYAFILGIMGVLFIFFSVMWLFVSVAVGVYFYDNGQSILFSIIYSIAFQLISFILLAALALFASQKLNTLKVLKQLNKASR